MPTTETTEAATAAPYTLRLIDPAPLPCTPWCTNPAHRDGTWEHLDATGNMWEQRVSACGWCTQVIGEVQWTDGPADPERPNARVTVRRYQSFESGEDDAVHAEPTSIKLEIHTDEELTPAGARKLVQLLTVAADRAEATR